MQINQFAIIYPNLAYFAERLSDEELMQKAYAQYKKGKPGLLERAGIIPDRRSMSATYNRRTKNGKMVVVRKGKRSKEYNKAKAMQVYKKGKPGLLEKAGIIPDRRNGN
jgi:hypothetical protein